MKKYLLMLFCLILGALLAQGFQCASPEYTTAKLALKRGEYPKAEEYLEKEVAKNSQNAEAWLYLAETKIALKKINEALTAVDKAEEHSKKDPKISVQVSALKRKLWIEAYTISIDYLQKSFAEKPANLPIYTLHADSALQAINTAIRIRPEISAFQSIKGQCFDILGDATNRVKAFETYYKMNLSAMEIAQKKGFYIGMPRNSMLKLLDKPTETFGMKLKSDDSTLTDVFTVNGKELIIFSQDQKDKNLLVKSWYYDLPASLPELERSQAFDFQISPPLVDLVQYYFDLKQYDKSLVYLNGILMIDPMNEDANRFMVTVYDAMGKKTDAANRVAEMVQKDPKNKQYRQIYGDILSQVEEYDKAIIQYEEALKIDPLFYDVLRNVGACYKNKAVLIQKKQIDDIEKDPTKKKQIDINEFKPLLLKSAENFEKCRKSVKYMQDYLVLNDLADIYYATEQLDKLKATVAEMETLEPVIPKESLEKYYYALIKIFQQRITDPKKSALYEQKARDLSN